MNINTQQTGNIVAVKLRRYYISAMRPLVAVSILIFDHAKSMKELWLGLVTRILIALTIKNNFSLNYEKFVKI
jgi:hypothetical protein